MAYARPFGQAQAASPWSAGVPPGLQQQQPLQPAQQMFNQPMGAFDLSGAWQGQQQAGQWAPQPMQPQVQFVQNPNAFMHHQPPQQQNRYHNQQQQRPMHQRSLSAPRANANGLNNNNKRGNQNSSFGNGGNNGGQWQQRQNANNNNNNNQQRNARQQSRQKVQFSNNNNNNSTNNNNSNNRQPNQQKQQSQQQQQSLKKGTVKVTKVVKKQNLKAKQGDAKPESADSSSTNAKADDTGKVVKATASNDSTKPSQSQQASKPQSKTAERKQFKLQARKNAESLKQNKLPVARGSSASSRAAAADGPGSEMKPDEGEPIDQAQLKCVPAVFGFVCKCCDVFLRDRFSRREHIDSDEHMQKFKVSEEEQKPHEAVAVEPKVEESTESSEAEKKPSPEEE